MTPQQPFRGLPPGLVPMQIPQQPTPEQIQAVEEVRLQQIRRDAANFASIIISSGNHGEMAFLELAKLIATFIERGSDATNNDLAPLLP